jgi:hypothetical protein
MTMAPTCQWMARSNTGILSVYSISTGPFSWSTTTTWSALAGNGSRHIGIMLKAPLGSEQRGPNLADRGKSGSKRHPLVDERGAPLALELDGVNRSDMRLLRPTLDAIVIDRPEPTLEHPQHL